MAKHHRGTVYINRTTKQVVIIEGKFELPAEWQPSRRRPFELVQEGYELITKYEIRKDLL